MTIRTGPICLHHKRWRHENSDIDVADKPNYLAAEKAFGGTLTDRGISIATGELTLANQLAHAWGSTNPKPTREDGSHLFHLFPATVKLAIALTDPEFVELLLNPRWSPSQHATLLSTTVTTVLGHPERSDSGVLWQTVNHHTRAVAVAYGMVGTRRRSQACTMERAFFTAAYTHRACLLRHLDARHMPRISNPKQGSPAPSAQRLAVLQRA